MRNWSNLRNYTDPRDSRFTFAVICMQPVRNRNIGRYSRPSIPPSTYWPSPSDTKLNTFFRLFHTEAKSVQNGGQFPRRAGNLFH